MLQKNVYNLFGQHSLGSCIKETSSNPYNIPKLYAHHHGVSLVTQMVKNLPADTGDVGLIPGSERSPGKGNGNPLQYSCLENSMSRGGWQATVLGMTKSWT